MEDKHKKNGKQEGDYKSIEQICNETWEPIYRYIYFKVQNREEAEDITQETYVRTLSHLKRSGFKPDNYLPYLKTAAMNILRDNWRKKTRQGVQSSIDNIDPAELSAGDPSEARTEQMLIADALKKLKDEQRMVLELRIIKGFSVAETARMMNKNEVTVRVMQHRALNILADLLEENI